MPATMPNLRVNGTMQALDELNGASWFPLATLPGIAKAWRMCTAARNGSYLWSGRVNQAGYPAG